MKLLSFDDLRALKGINYCKASLWRLEKAGEFPRRVPLGASRHGWVEAEIDARIEGRVKQRNASNSEAA